jgi:hypothetical protein
MGPGQIAQPQRETKSFEKHSDMAALSALERLQLELAEAHQALVEAERQRQQERQRADEAEQQQQQAEQERQQERRRAEEAEQERQYERQRNQPTTLDEFLEACDLHISKPLAVQTDRSLSTGGGITKPNNRHYPQKLRQWTHFPDTQARLFHRVHIIGENSLQRILHKSVA